VYELISDTWDEDLLERHRNGVHMMVNEFPLGEGVGRVEPIQNYIIEENIPRFWTDFNWGKTFGKEIPEEIEYSGRSYSFVNFNKYKIPTYVANDGARAIYLVYKKITRNLYRCTGIVYPSRDMAFTAIPVID
jgi:hypothetical protein